MTDSLKMESNEETQSREASVQDDVENDAYKAVLQPEEADTTDDDEDASHKRKYTSDEPRSDVSPARKKLSTEEQHYTTDGVNLRPASSEDDPVRGVSKFGLDAAVPGTEHLIQDSIECPSGLIGRLIGKHGETIKYLQGETNTKLQIDHQSQGARKKVGISGPNHEAVRRVKSLIQNVLESDVAPVVPGEMMETLDCPQGIVGRVIGRRGETIKALQSASGAKIIVEQNFPEGVPRKVKISGRPDVVGLAAKMVSELISGEPGSAIGVINKYTTSATASRVVECPKSMVGRVIGKGGETIKSVQATTGAVVQIQQDADPCYITISGSHNAVEAASSIIEEISRGGTPLRSPPSAFYGIPRSPSMGDYSPYAAHPYGPMMHHGGAFGGPGGAYGGGYMGGYSPHPPAGYGYYGSMGGYPPQDLHPSNLHVPSPPPPHHGYGYSGYSPQPGTPYGPPQLYSQGSGGFRPSEMYPQGPVPPPATDGPPSIVSNNWTELSDVEGRLYYYNNQTGVSQWEKPTDFQ